MSINSCLKIDPVRDGSRRPNSGRPGIDYPIFHEIPETSFSCKEQRYKGFFGDVDTGCQVSLNLNFLFLNNKIISRFGITAI